LVNLSPSPCWTRLRKLEAAGYIRGYHAEIALHRIGEFTQIVMTVSLTQHRKSDFEGDRRTKGGPAREQSVKHLAVNTPRSEGFQRSVHRPHLIQIKESIGSGY